MRSSQNKTKQTTTTTKPQGSHSRVLCGPSSRHPPLPGAHHAFSHLQVFALAGPSAIKTLAPSHGWANPSPFLGLKHKRLFQKQPPLSLPHFTHFSRHPVLFAPNTCISYCMSSLVLSTLHALTDGILTMALGGRHCHYLPLRGEEN